jgi:rsbT co-antagonist protein RsbR
VITGIRPEVARTLVGLRVELHSIITPGTLQSGIAFALAQSGKAHVFVNGNGKKAY